MKPCVEVPKIKPRFRDPGIKRPRTIHGYRCDHCHKFFVGFPHLLTADGEQICLRCSRYYGLCNTCNGWFNLLLLRNSCCPECCPWEHERQLPRERLSERRERIIKRFKERRELLLQRISNLSPVERDIYDKFMKKYAQCPICNHKIRPDILNRLFFDPQQWQEGLRSAMKSALQSKSKVEIGIPCCGCYNKVHGLPPGPGARPPSSGPQRSAEDLCRSYFKRNV